MWTLWLILGHFVFKGVGSVLLVVRSFLLSMQLFLVERMGRRPLLLIGLMGMAVSAVFLTVAMLLLVRFQNLLASSLLVSLHKR